MYSLLLSACVRSIAQYDITMMEASAVRGSAAVFITNCFCFVNLYQITATCMYVLMCTRYVCIGVRGLGTSPVPIDWSVRSSVQHRENSYETPRVLHPSAPSAQVLFLYQITGGKPVPHVHPSSIDNRRVSYTNGGVAAVSLVLRIIREVECYYCCYSVQFTYSSSTLTAQTTVVVPVYLDQIHATLYECVVY